MFGVSMLKGDFSKKKLGCLKYLPLIYLSLKYFLELVEQCAVMGLR